MSNLWQKLQDGSGEQRANCKCDEKGKCILHIACLHERNDEDSGEGEGIDHGHTQERKAPHWRQGRVMQCKELIEVKRAKLLWDNKQNDLKKEKKNKGAYIASWYIFGAP